MRWNSLKPNNMNVSTGSADASEDRPPKATSPSMNNLIGSLEDMNRSRNSDEYNASSVLLPGRSTQKFEFKLETQSREPQDSDSLNDSMIYNMRRSSSSETEEENWKTKIERGAYTEKVRQKSRSVTDLMVLTHIDCSESESETPQPSLDHKVNYKNVRLAPRNNLESLSYVHGSEGNLLSVQDDFQAELRKLQEEHRDSLFFVPDKYSQINNNLGVDENMDSSSSGKRLLAELSGTNEMKPTNQVFNVFNVTIDKLSPVDVVKLNEIINLEEPMETGESKTFVSYEVPRLRDIIQNNSDIATLNNGEQDLSPTNHSLVKENDTAFPSTTCKFFEESLSFADEENVGLIGKSILSSTEKQENFSLNLNRVGEECFLNAAEPKETSEIAKNDASSVEVERISNDGQQETIVSSPDLTVEDPESLGKIGNSAAIPAENYFSTEIIEETEEHTTHSSLLTSAEPNLRIEYKLISQISSSESEPGEKKEEKCMVNGEHGINLEITELHNISNESSVSNVNMENVKIGNSVSLPCEILSTCETSTERKVIKSPSQPEKYNSTDTSDIEGIKIKVSIDTFGTNENEELYEPDNVNSPSENGVEAESVLVLFKNSNESFLEPVTCTTLSRPSVEGENLDINAKSEENVQNNTSLPFIITKSHHNSLQNTPVEKSETNLSILSPSSNFENSTEVYEHLQNASENNTSEGANQNISETLMDVQKVLPCRTENTVGNLGEQFGNKPLDNLATKEESATQSRYLLSSSEGPNLENSTETEPKNDMKLQNDSQPNTLQNNSEDKGETESNILPTIMFGSSNCENTAKFEDQMKIINSSQNEIKVDEVGADREYERLVEGDEVLMNEILYSNAEKGVEILDRTFDKGVENVGVRKESEDLNKTVLLPSNCEIVEFPRKYEKLLDCIISELHNETESATGESGIHIQHQSVEKSKEICDMLNDNVQDHLLGVAENPAINRSNESFYNESEIDFNCENEDRKKKDYKQLNPVEDIPNIEPDTCGNNDDRTELSSGDTTPHSPTSTIAVICVETTKNDITEVPDRIRDETSSKSTKEECQSEINQDQTIVDNKTSQENIAKTFIKEGEQTDRIELTREFLEEERKATHNFQSEHSCQENLTKPNTVKLHQVPKLTDLIESNDELMEYIISNYESELYDENNTTQSDKTVVLPAVEFDLSDSQEIVNPNSMTHLNAFSSLRTKQKSLDLFSSTPSKKSFSSLREESDDSDEAANLNYSLETWDNFLGDAIDSQNRSINDHTVVFESLNSEPQSLVFIDNDDRNVMLTPPNSDTEASLDDRPLADVYGNQTINDGLDETFTVEEGDLNRTYEVSHLNDTFTVDGDCSKEAVASGSWESNGGWFLHPQSSGTISGQMTEQKPKENHSRFEMDDEILAALRGELLAKLPHAQGVSSDRVNDNEDDWSPGDRDEVFLRYNVYNTPLSPIPEECESDQGADSGCTTPGSPDSVASDDWHDKILQHNAAGHQDNDSQSLRAQGLHHQHTLSQDSCCSNDTLFNLEDMTLTVDQEKEAEHRFDEEQIKHEAINYFKIGTTVAIGSKIPDIDLESPIETPVLDKTYISDFLDKEREHSESLCVIITDTTLTDNNSESNSSRCVPVDRNVAPLPSPDDHPWRQLSASLLNYDRSQKRVKECEEATYVNEGDVRDHNYENVCARGESEYSNVIRGISDCETNIRDYVNLGIDGKKVVYENIENVGDILNEADYVNITNLENFKISAEFRKTESGDFNETTSPEYVNADQDGQDLIIRDAEEEPDDDLFGVLTDIRFSGPGESHLMSTSFSESNDLNNDQDWDSGSDTRSSSSGEFIWKEGEHEESLKALQALPQDPLEDVKPNDANQGAISTDSSSSDEEGECPEFVPSAWDKYATPTKSALRSPEKTMEKEDKKKGVWFKKQRYHCVYEYPREPESPILQSFDLWNSSPPATSYPDWYFDIGTGSEFSEFTSSTNPSDGDTLSTDFNTDFNDEFFVTGSATPFDMMGGNTSQFFPGGDHWSDVSSKLNENTTPDSGVEDIITPGSLADRLDFGSLTLSSSTVPSLKLLAGAALSRLHQKEEEENAANDIMGGLRHTRDRLKLDLPPSPNTFTSNKTFNLELSVEPVVLRERPSFTTFGKSRFLVQHVDTPDKDAKGNNVCFEALPYKPPEELSSKNTKKDEEKGEANLLDSADEDSGIESSTLERKSGDEVGKLIL